MKDKPNVSMDFNDAVLLAHSILQLEGIAIKCRTVNISYIRGGGVDIEFCGLKGVEE